MFSLKLSKLCFNHDWRKKKPKMKTKKQKQNKAKQKYKTHKAKKQIDIAILQRSFMMKICNSQVLGASKNQNNLK